MKKVTWVFARNEMELARNVAEFAHEKAPRT